MKITVIAVILLLSVTGSVGVYVKILKNENENLTIQNEGLVQSLKVQKELLLFEEQQNKVAIERLTELEITRRKAEENVKHLRSLYADHDFSRLLKSKPGLMSKRMLKATEDKLYELQIITSE